MTISPGRSEPSDTFVGTSNMPAVAAMDDRVWLPHGSHCCRGDVIDCVDVIVWLAADAVATAAAPAAAANAVLPVATGDLLLEPSRSMHDGVVK